MFDTGIRASRQSVEFFFLVCVVLLLHIMSHNNINKYFSGPNTNMD